MYLSRQVIDEVCSAGDKCQSMNRDVDPNGNQLHILGYKLGKSYEGFMVE